jgi:hydroxyacyl-ACP dehydratase HTD2-like protein with hotdog domain
MVSDALAAWVARPPDIRPVIISHQDIARFAIAIGATDEAHFSAAAARRRGFPDVVAPPLFYISLRTGVFNLVRQDQLHEEGTPLQDIPPITFRRAMAGETTAELHRPFFAGEAITCMRRAETAFCKEGRSGTLTFIRFEYRYTSKEGGPIAAEHFTRIFH